MNSTSPLFAALILLLSVSAEYNTNECPPGTLLHVDCTETNCTECRSCSAGFYTGLRNDIRDCLPCDLCGLNQEETQPCTITHNRVCQCKEGYYWLSHYCKKHTVCPVGHGIKSKGTPTKNTECEPCVNSHYAARAADSKQCTPHTPCHHDERLVIKGTDWHNNICVTCNDITTRGWSRLIEPLLSELFAQQKPRRLRRIIRHLLPLARRQLPTLQEWLSGAPEENLIELPRVLKRAKLHTLSEKVEHKLKKFQEEAKYCNNIM